MYTQEHLLSVEKAIQDLTEGKTVASVTWPDGKKAEYSQTSLPQLIAHRKSIQSEIGAPGTGIEVINFCRA
ncbi:MAG: hypothetical protein GY710_00435 [Desulfobacteraceae bacterium]|nr:hypothetical protein [Desulfobacteraceae bacterium]